MPSSAPRPGGDLAHRPGAARPSAHADYSRQFLHGPYQVAECLLRAPAGSNTRSQESSCGVPKAPVRAEATLPGWNHKSSEEVVMISPEASLLGARLDEHHSPETNGRMPVCRRCGAQTESPQGRKHVPNERLLARSEQWLVAQSRMQHINTMPESRSRGRPLRPGPLASCSAGPAYRRSYKARPPTTRRDQRSHGDPDRMVRRERLEPRMSPGQGCPFVAAPSGYVRHLRGQGPYLSVGTHD